MLEHNGPLWVHTDGKMTRTRSEFSMDVGGADAETDNMTVDALGCRDC